MNFPSPHAPERPSWPTARPPLDSALAARPRSIWIVWLSLSAVLFCLLAFCCFCFWVGRVRRRRWAADRARRRARASWARASARAAPYEIPILTASPTPLAADPFVRASNRYCPDEDVLLGLENFNAFANARHGGLGGLGGLGGTSAARLNLYYMQMLSALAVAPHQGPSVGADDAAKAEERGVRRGEDGDEPPSYDEACGPGRLCRLAVLLRFRPRPGAGGPGRGLEDLGPEDLGPEHSPLSPFCGCVACAVPRDVMPPTVAAAVQPPSYEEYMTARSRGLRAAAPPAWRQADPLSSANFCLRAGRIFGTNTNVGRLLQAQDEPPTTGGARFDEPDGPV